MFFYQNLSLNCLSFDTDDVVVTGHPSDSSFQQNSADFVEEDQGFCPQKEMTFWSITRSSPLSWEKHHGQWKIIFRLVWGKDILRSIKIIFKISNE